MVNKVILLGIIGKDPIVKHLDSGKAIAAFSLATSKKWKDKSGEKQEQTTWHNIFMYSPLAEVAEKYLKKGSKVYLEGEISNRSYDDKDGNKRYVSEVMANSLTMLDSKPANEQKSGYSEPPLQAQHGAESDDLPF